MTLIKAIGRKSLTRGVPQHAGKVVFRVELHQPVASG